MRPLIGLNTSLLQMRSPYQAKAVCLLKYVDAVAGAGGVPLLIPPYTDVSMLAAALAPCQGFCFIGGPDYDPAHYGGHAQPPGEVMHARRQRFDLCLAKMILKETQKPVLGICGGHQLLNIALGGALVQELKTEWRPGPRHIRALPHAAPERRRSSQAGNRYRHEVTLAAGSRIACIVGAPTVMANSFHHQAVQPRRLGRGLIATAWAADGVIEALEPASGARFILGVQWHPERQADEPRHQAVFRALVQAAGG